MNRIKRRTFTSCLLSLLIFFLNTQVGAESKPDIKIGMTVPLSGEMKPIGEGEKIGVSVYFDKINAAGGINGAMLSLIALNDSYDAIQAGKNVRQLIDQNIFAMIGNMGSAPAAVTLPIINANNILLFAPVTGSPIYRKKPPDHNIFNFRASLNEETSTLIKGALAMGIKPNEFAFFTQNDDFGNAVYESAVEKLNAIGFHDTESLPYGRFIRETTSIEGALAEIIAAVIKKDRSDPKAFILAGNYYSNAKFIQLAHQQFPNAIFLSVSGRINPSDFDKNEKALIVTIELVPYLDANLPAAHEFQEDLIKYAKNVQPTYEIFEGYLSAKLFVMALQKAALKNNLTREGVISALESMQNVDLGIGIKISFDKNEHQALHVTWPVIVEDSQYKPFKFSAR